MSSLSLSTFTPNYGFARTRDLAFAAVRNFWKLRQAEGMTQADLAERLGRDKAWVSRKLSGPTNWTLRTFGDLVDAMDGEVEITIADIRNAPSGNYDAYADYGEKQLEKRWQPPQNTSNQGSVFFFQGASGA